MFVVCDVPTCVVVVVISRACAVVYERECFATEEETKERQEATKFTNIHAKNAANNQLLLAINSMNARERKRGGVV